MGGTLANQFSFLLIDTTLAPTIVAKIATILRSSRNQDY